MKEISINELNENAFDLIKNQWAIITVKTNDKVNGMTANWVQLGHLWNNYVISLYVRKQRYTYEYIDNTNEYSVCFFDNKYKEQLTYLGTKSGKDYDKLKECKMTTNKFNNVDYINEAKLVFICEKIYVDDIKPNNFIDNNINDNCYPNKDYHRVYVSKIKHVLINEGE